MDVEKVYLRKNTELINFPKHLIQKWQVLLIRVVTKH